MKFSKVSIISLSMCSIASIIIFVLYRDLVEIQPIAELTARSPNDEQSHVVEHDSYNEDTSEYAVKDVANGSNNESDSVSVLPDATSRFNEFIDEAEQKDSLDLPRDFSSPFSIAQRNRLEQAVAVAEDFGYTKSQKLSSFEFLLALTAKDASRFPRSEEINSLWIAGDFPTLNSIASDRLNLHAEDVIGLLIIMELSRQKQDNESFIGTIERILSRLTMNTRQLAVVQPALVEDLRSQASRLLKIDKSQWERSVSKDAKSPLIEFPASPYLRALELVGYF